VDSAAVHAVSRENSAQREGITITSRAVNFLSYAILSGGIATVPLTIYLVVVAHSRLPFWDGWAEID
jgi:hypothetical protein